MTRGQPEGLLASGVSAYDGGTNHDPRHVRLLSGSWHSVIVSFAVPTYT